jgi:hypothetical protein
MGYEKKCLSKCVFLAILVGLLSVSFQPGLADTHTEEKSLNQALKSVKQAGKMAGEKDVKKELKNVGKVLSEAGKDLKKKNIENAVNKIKAAVKSLNKMLSYPGAQDEKLLGKINGALKNLYMAIRKIGGYKITTKTSHGLHTVTLNTYAGFINLNLPGGIAAGDTISGSLYVQSNGRTNTEKTKNEGVLNEHMVEIKEIKDQRIPVTKKLNSWPIPKTANVIHPVFTDKDGLVVGSGEVLVYPPYHQPELTDFKLHTLGTAGRFLHIPGPFDGNHGNTEVVVGESSANLLAESPLGATVHTPTNVIGQTTITLKEGDREKTGEFRLASLSITAGKSTLRPGETTTLTVRIKGLNELKDEVPLVLINRTPAIVRMEGGTFQFRVIHGEDIRPGGIYSLTRTLTGKNRGTFRIWAEIDPGLVEAAKILGQLTGKELKNEGFSEQEIVTKIGKDSLNFVIEDLNHYKLYALGPSNFKEYMEIGQSKPSIFTCGLGLMALELLDFFDSVELEHQQWLRNIYINNVFKGFRE